MSVCQGWPLVSAVINPRLEGIRYMCKKVNWKPFLVVELKGVWSSKLDCQNLRRHYGWWKNVVPIVHGTGIVTLNKEQSISSLLEMVWTESTCTFENALKAKPTLRWIATESVILAIALPQCGALLPTPPLPVVSPCHQPRHTAFNRSALLSLLLNKWISLEVLTDLLLAQFKHIFEANIELSSCLHNRLTAMVY